jgi:hypothetical protein
VAFLSQRGIAMLERCGAQPCERTGMLTLHFNKVAWDAFAKELRRASWGAAVVMAGLGLKTSSAIAGLLGGIAWAVLQALAIVVQSITVKGGKR